MQPCHYVYHFKATQRKFPHLKVQAAFHRRIDVFKRKSSTGAQTTLTTTSARLQTLLPKILQKERLPAWNQALEHVLRQNSTGQSKRIAVHGLDKLADSRSLLMALLDNPFASSTDDMKTLRHRISRFSGSVVTITTVPDNDNSLFCGESNVSRLTYFNAELLEIPFLHPDALPLLWSADVKILVATPLAGTLTPDYLSLISHPSTLLTLQYTENDPKIAHYILSSLTRLQPEVIPSTAIHSVNPIKALSATEKFRSSPSTVTSVNAFQLNYLDSGISLIVEKLHSLLSKDVVEGGGSVHIATGTLDACYESIHLLREDISTTLRQVHTLQHNVNSVRTTSSYQLNVSDSVSESSRRMSDVIHRISWWKLPLMVDDLSHTLIDVIQRSWCSDLISRIDYQAGRLSLLREQTISQTIDCYSQLPKPFQSAVLKNVLDQHSSGLSGIGPSSLLYPITRRTRQLTESATKLHRQVQNALLASSCGILGSFFAAYIAWYGQYSSIYGALGFGSFGIILVLRLFLRRWNKIKRGWWVDWSRVGQGLERDMKGVIQQAIEKKVLNVPSKAIEILQESIQNRTEELDAMQRELDEIRIASREYKGP